MIDKRIFLLMAGIGILGAITSLGILSQTSSFFKDKIASQLVLRNGSESWKQWLDPGVPVYMKFYLFNITNPEEYGQGQENPNMTEVGPFVFQEVRTKNVDRLSEDLTRVFYADERAFVFVQELSGASLDDEITFINVPANAAVTKIIKMGEQIASLFLQIIQQIFATNKVTLFETHSAGQILFDGFKISFMDDLNKILAQRGIPPSPTQFGLMYKKNNTDEGLMEAYTGVDSIDHLMSIKSWNGNETLDIWNGSSCNTVGGTDGSGFKPNLRSLSKDKHLDVFVAQLCRSLKLEFESLAKVKGVNTAKYTAPKETFQSPSTNPDNECYCIEDDLSKCNIDGLLDLSTCQKSPSIYASSPHFYLGSPELSQNVTGLNPEAEKHGTFLYVEQMTGKVFKAAKRIQLNTQVRKNLRILNNVGNVMYPIAWFEESFEITDDKAEQFKSKITRKMSMVVSIIISGAVFSIFLLLAGLGLHTWAKSRE
ncbi:platelet glycoprotein 4-like isoform X2 [Brevipalpus obovatus]|uniref:platelet glycoprotein 4-like isoform X2 n=1 Tax=Brevipalpus obovatus TaxID=246614 RepID=UPI003D9DC359